MGWLRSPWFQYVGVCILGAAAIGAITWVQTGEPLGLLGGALFLVVFLPLAVVIAIRVSDQEDRHK